MLSPFHNFFITSAKRLKAAGPPEDSLPPQVTNAEVAAQGGAWLLQPLQASGSWDHSVWSDPGKQPSHQATLPQELCLNHSQGNLYPTEGRALPECGQRNSSAVSPGGDKGRLRPWPRETHPLIAVTL